MTNKGYLGPAGIFSTDDWAADRRQIEAEQWDPEYYDQQGYPVQDCDEIRPEESEQEHYEEDYPRAVEEEAPVMIEACVGSIDCTWWHMETIEEDDFNAWTERMKAKHQKECGCSATLDSSHS